MAKFVPKTYEQVLQREIDRVVARSALSDINETAALKAVLAATAREVADAYFQMKNLVDLFSIDRAAGDDLDERAKDYNPTIISRNPATVATGNLVFTRAVAGPIVIPSGTRVEVPGSNPPAIARTVVSVSILSGTSSGNVSSAMESAGLAGNVAAGTLTQFKGLRPSGIDAVTNLAGFVGGADKETDDSFRARIKNFVSTLSRCTPQALETAALLVSTTSGQRIVFARTVEDPIKLGRVYLYVDDGTGAAETNASVVGEILTSGPSFPGNVALGGEVYLYANNFPIKDSATINIVRNVTTLVRDDPGPNGFTLNSASGQVFLNTALVAGDAVTADYTYFTGILKEVQKVIDGDVTNPTVYPGWRAAGVLVLVRVPTVLTVTIVANIVVLDGYSQATVAANVATAVAAYVNSLGIGNDVIHAEITQRAMAVEGMYDITITAPSANVVVLDDQLPRTNTTSDITIV
jgi:uncharacterized phage protein gp47/JayE